MPLPARDPEQRRAALEKASEARRIRAELKQMLKTGEVSLPEVLRRAHDHDALAKMKVVELLESLPNTGKVTARRVMDELDINHSRRLKGLGSKQRERLLEKFTSP